MEIFSAILGVVALVGSLITAGVSAKKAREADDYNKELNQTIMDREDNSWQRAVEDRSKAGLSIAGLTQGAGAGGTVSQLQSQQSGAMQGLSNILQNGSGTMFGLANSAYDRKLQKENFTQELKLKRDQLKHERLTSRLNYMMDLARLKMDTGIYSHNMKIAKGQQDAVNWNVYGSNPSEIERLLTGIWNNRDSVKSTLSDVKDNVVDTVTNISNKVKTFFTGVPEGAFNDVSPDKIQEALGDFTIDKINSPITNIAVSQDHKHFYLMQKDGNRIELSKYQYNNMCKLIGRTLEK